MKEAVAPSPAPTRLVDYRPPDFVVDDVHLSFALSPQGTRVTSRIRFRRNPDGNPQADLVLDGEGLRLQRAAIDGTELAVGAYLLTPTQLTVPAGALPGDAFTWEAMVEIDPEENTALEGLYRSNGMFCTQCEPEGFRKITFYPDRPDVMAPFRVRMHTDGDDLPVLLSNGNLAAAGPGWAEWHDPWPKPAYLFALVAGDLRKSADTFTTMSGRRIELGIWVRPGDEDRTGFAMDALKRAMRWDEEVYGREYDLDVFNIVAVDDFNMGAMENKGLNIFNSSCVLAKPATSTDADFERIEAIVAHEYFHNWTGNRITCRDWFQLCLKEGLTVFRDQQFSGDERGHAVRRIDDVLMLRARQFREDQGPLAHPVRPDSYIEINNFYTATVYEKGAELIGMLRRLVGADLYRAALDLYFDRHDGQACTIEDFLQVFEDATGRDLSQFKRWYTQAGTPRVGVDVALAGTTCTLTLRQHTPPTPGQPLKEPLVIPLRVGLLDDTGAELLPDTLLELTDPEQSFTFELPRTPGRVIASLNRGFGAPLLIEHPQPVADRLVLLGHDTDPVNRWDAGRSLMRAALVADLGGEAFDTDAVLAALDRLLGDASLDPAFRALALGLPSEDDLQKAALEAGMVPDPSAIHRARRKMQARLGVVLGQRLADLYDAHAPGPVFRPDAAQAGTRALRNAALRPLTAADGIARAQAQFDAAATMTDRIAALTCLVEAGETEPLARFEHRWRDDRLVMDKWFALQVAHAPPAEAVARARALGAHPLFDPRNPNRLRAVIGGLTANLAGFHDPSGAGYAFVADWLLRTDARNPQIAARLSTAFETWPRFDPDRQALMRAQLDRVAAAEGLSPDLSEMVARMQAA